MFSSILAVDESSMQQSISASQETPFTAITDENLLEITFLQELLRHANRLMESIDDNALTCIIKKQILKISSLLVQATDSKLNGIINAINVNLTGNSLDNLEEIQIMRQSKMNEYTIGISQPQLPKVLLSQIGGIPASCGLHAVMHMLLSMGFTSNFFDFNEISSQKLFAQGFNRLNNGEMCTVMSEINDVLRSFADTLAAFIPPSRVYASVGTKGLNDYNFCDFLKPSVKMNFGLKKGLESYKSLVNRDTEMNIKESIIYDINKLSPEWLLFDIGMWCCFADGINIEINIHEHRYRLHSFIANTGLHYVCCILDMINTERGLVNVVRIYDDMSIGQIRMAPLNMFSINSIGALVFHKI